jgi:hypothetical protein
LYPSQQTSVDIVRTNSSHGQWRIGPIPKLTPFTFWDRKWEIRVSTHPHMGWGLYAMEAAKVGDELLPFVGKQLSGAEFKRMCQANQRFAKYAIHVKKNVIKMEML